jgi:glycosyltransferase involved in cell wall biosynthesis
MIRNLLEGHYTGFELIHQRLSFSGEMDEVGKFSPRKLVELVRVIFGIVICRLRFGPRILYYPPAGPQLVPVLRDLAILGSTRWLFRRTIFHFHAGGIGDYERRLWPPLRPLFRLAFSRPDAGIRVSHHAAPDPAALAAVREFIVPNAIEGRAGTRLSNPTTKVPKFLYVGLISEAKGVLVLLEACALLHSRSVPFHLHMVGAVDSADFGSTLRDFVMSRGLEGRVTLAGELTGPEKWDQYETADAFCFPSHHPTETFGIVLLEAMSYSLPVVATRWRGTVDIVEDGETGYLVPVRDASEFADRMAKLAVDPLLRCKMGEQGRRRFQTRFALERYHQDLLRVFQCVSGSPA